MAAVADRSFIGETAGAERVSSSVQFEGCWRVLLVMAELALKVIQGLWNVLIPRELIDEVQLFSALQRALPGVSQKVLTSQLRELEVAGVVVRTIYPKVPPRVENALTDLGRELFPALDDLHAWGERQADFNSASR